MRNRLCIFVVIIIILLSCISIQASNVTQYSINFSKEELEFLQANKKIYYGVEKDYAPVEFVDRDGRPNGFGVEYIREAEKILGIDFIYSEQTKEMTWEQMLNMLRQGELDLLPTTTQTELREQYLTFTKPYLQMNTDVLSYNTDHMIFDVNGLEGKTGTFVNGHWQIDYLASQGVSMEIKQTDIIYDSLELIDRRLSEYTFLESAVYDYYNKMGGFNNIHVVGNLDIESSYCIAVSNEISILASILNKVIDVVPKGKIYNRIIYQEKEKINSIYIVLLVAIIIVLFILLAYALNKLAREHQYKKTNQKHRNQLIESLSHDLKTPLTKLKLNMDLINKGIVPKNKISDFRQRIENNVKDIDTMINDLYSIVHLKEQMVNEGMTKKDFVSFILKLRADYKSLCKANNRQLDFRCDIQSTISINMNSKSMKRVFDNLINNAIKYTEDNNKISMLVTLKGSNLICSIKDEGRGIASKDLKYVFERFYRGRNNENSVKGKGLGLNIVKQIVEHHKGSVEIDSVLGEFTKVTIILPTVYDARE